MIESYIKSAIEKEKRGDTRDIACLMLVALNKHYITRSDLYNRFGKLRWPKKNAMDTILDYFLPRADITNPEYVLSKYNCEYNNIIKNAFIPGGEKTYKCDLLKAEEFAMVKFPRETLQIVSLIEGQPIHIGRSITPTKITANDLIAAHCDSLKATLLSKNDRYGNSSLDPINIFSLNRESKIEARISDKLSRMKSMQHDKQSKDYIDAVLDLTGYLVLYHIALTNKSD